MKGERKETFLKEKVCHTSRRKGLDFQFLSVSYFLNRERIKSYEWLVVSESCGVERNIMVQREFHVKNPPPHFFTFLFLIFLFYFVLFLFSLDMRDIRG